MYLNNISLYDSFGSSMTQDRSTTHPKFDLSGVRIHDLQIGLNIFYLSQDMIKGSGRPVMTSRS